MGRAFFTLLCVLTNLYGWFQYLFDRHNRRFHTVLTGSLCDRLDFVLFVASFNFQVRFDACKLCLLFLLIFGNYVCLVKSYASLWLRSLFVEKSPKKLESNFGFVSSPSALNKKSR